MDSATSHFVMSLRLIKRLLLIPALLMLAACASRVEDDTIGRPVVCVVHGVQMTKRKVPIEYGLIRPTDYSRAFFAASTNGFPNAQEFVGGGCCVMTPTTAVIYVCPKCEEARRLWESDHAQLQRASQPPWVGR